MTAISITKTPKTWNWRGYDITYQQEGNTGHAVVLVHGFGASWGHWRKNLPVLGESCRCYAIDLIGFGGSAKPEPSTEIEYTFETWGEQLADFCREVVGGSAFLIGNSIGCIVVMQTAVDHPELALGVAAINCSIRLLHDRKRNTLPWYRNYGSLVMQQVLGNRNIGNFFFKQIAKPKASTRSRCSGGFPRFYSLFSRALTRRFIAPSYLPDYFVMGNRRSLGACGDGQKAGRNNYGR